MNIIHTKLFTVEYTFYLTRNQMYKCIESKKDLKISDNSRTASTPFKDYKLNSPQNNAMLTSMSQRRLFFEYTKIWGLHIDNLKIF